MARAGRPGDPRSLVLRADAAFGAGRAADAGRFAAAAIARAEQVLDEHAAADRPGRSPRRPRRALRGARRGEPAGLGHRPRRHRGSRPPGRPGRGRARPGALARHGAVPARDDGHRCAPTTPRRSCRPGSWPSTPACSGRSRPSTTSAPTTPGGSTARPRPCRWPAPPSSCTRALRLPQRAFSARSMLEMLEAATHLVDGTATPSEARRRADGIASQGGGGPRLEQVVRVVVALLEHDLPRAADELATGVARGAAARRAIPPLPYLGASALVDAAIGREDEWAERTLRGRPGPGQPRRLRLGRRRRGRPGRSPRRGRRPARRGRRGARRPALVAAGAAHRRARVRRHRRLGRSRAHPARRPRRPRAGRPRPARPHLP